MPRLTLETPADVRLLDSGMSVGEALAAFNAAHPDAGGIATFLGKVRPDGNVKALELSHYEPLTLPGMQELTQEAQERFSLDGALVWHRVGVMAPGDAIVLVAAAARRLRGRRFPDGPSQVGSMAVEARTPRRWLALDRTAWAGP